MGGIDMYIVWMKSVKKKKMCFKTNPEMLWLHARHVVTKI